MTFLIALLLVGAAPPHPCLQDAERLCPGVKAGEGRVATCLREHKAEVSAACKKRIAHFREESEACQRDVARLCPDTRPGAERARCLRQHADRVSPDCQQLFGRARERHGDVREAMRACREDARRLCSDLKPGDGRVAQCLTQHQAELSQGCANSLK
jgi:hypothetical protein